MINTIMNYIYVHSAIIELLLGLSLIFISLCESAQEEIEEYVKFQEEERNDRIS